AKLIELDGCFACTPEIAESFADKKMIQGIFIDIFSSLLNKDNMCDRPDIFGKRIFLPTTITNILNTDSVGHAMGRQEFTLDVLVNHLRMVLHHCKMSRAKLAFNFIHGRVDVMDSNDYNKIGTDYTQHHKNIGRRTMKRLSNALWKAFPSTLKRFGNYCLCKIEAPVTVPCSNDCVLRDEVYGGICWFHHAQVDLFQP
ncbi:hypothetical protein E2562_028765, partial [Oryza meyeriana var. granulata]